ncbi:unnamed protein product [Lymnaea stagnalis]|uniref:ABC-type glutathione-S-conjugate transporter n=1 Tax=Lymnaea stagnalis TaxID=6523 RepID=A0AAV2I5X8_LYMST
MSQAYTTGSLCQGEPLWDAELTWTNNTWPQFTECFQKSALTWGQCGLLWLMAPFYAYHLLMRKKNLQPIRFLFCAKIFFSITMIVVNVVEAIEKFRSVTSLVYKVAPIIWISTMVLHSCLVYSERSRKVTRSPVLFIFWAVTAIAELIPFYSAIILQTFANDSSHFAVICLRFSIPLVFLLLNCFPDYVREKDKVGKSPESYASLLSWLSMSWFNRLAWKGLRTQINDVDIYPLHYRDKPKQTFDKFMHAWDNETNKLQGTEQKYKLSDDWEKEMPLLPRKTTIQPSLSHHSLPVDEKDGYNIPTVTVNMTSSHESLNERPTDISNAAVNYFDPRKLGNVETEKPQVSLWKLMIKCYWLEAVSAQSGMVMYVVEHGFGPIVLGLLINFTKDTSEPNWHGYIYAATFIFLRILYNVSVVMSKWCNSRFASRTRGAGIAAVFQKALTISSEARKETTVGEIMNLMSVDTGLIETMVFGSFWSWMSVALIAIGIYLLYTVVGLTFFAGLALILLFFGVNIGAAQKLSEFQEKIMVIKDERIKAMNEMLNGIKVIKLYGWEPMFIKKIQDIREKELKILLKCSILAGIETFAWHVSMVWALYMMLVTFVMTSDDHYLAATTLFLTLNYNNLVKIGINMLPSFITDFVKARNSIKRLNKYLNSEDINTVNLIRNKTDPLAVRVENADFTWNQSEPCTLNNINLSVETGLLVAVVGTVGSGKSSFLSALLGEMHKLNGYFNLNSSVAYVPQQAWIQNNTVRENILFGRPYDRQFFQQVISACALLPDLDMMPAGDQTEIGEKGINLSGGQKQRVSLARAIYSQADIYLMDDPLSAVDSHVGRHIFDQVLGKSGLLSGKTIILVTHGIHWLKAVDHIVVMSNGTVSEYGSFEELLSHNGAFAQFLTQYLTQEADTESLEDEDIEIKSDILRRLVSVTSESDDSVISEKVAEYKKSLSGSLMRLNTGEVRHRKSSEKSSHLKSSEKLGDVEQILKQASQNNINKTTDQSRLTSDEKRQEGKVNWSVYWQLINSLGHRNAVIIFALFVCYQVIFTFCNFWLAGWSDDAQLNNFTALPANSTEREDRNVYYIGVFSGLTILVSAFDIAYAIVFQIGHIKASRKFHTDLLMSIMHAPMSFFDTTPIGRILNRFSQDIDIVDNNIFVEIETVLDVMFRCLTTCIIISYTMPIFLSVVVPVVIVIYFIQQIYIRTSCQLRRIASNNRSPVYAHFSEALSGVSVIRAYQAQDRFIADSLQKVDNFQKAHLASKALNRWLEAHLNMVTYLIVGASVLFAVMSRDVLSPGLVGLAITYALKVSSDLTTVTMVFGNLENHIVSVERILEYSTIVKEAPWVAQPVDDEWPSSGKLQFVNYSTRYREGLNLVLRGLNCEIKAGEKVGIVGRTGAGKSSMMLSLFRLIEASEGNIIIDDLDISKLGLHTLRRKLTILPQDPTLFAGSLRMNLDPFNEKSDADLWRALEHSHLKSFVESLPEKLENEVGEGGQNLSMGQRQLICLARTLLRKSKIFILDEATAAVDMGTDDLIQRSIREEFEGCTILTIAHRLNTVLDYDRIMVLDNGQVVEYDSPKNLLSRPDSIFYSMAAQSGLV